MSRPRPWDGIVPQADIDTFNTTLEEIERPLSGGRSPALVIVDMTWAFVDSRFPTGHGATGWPCVGATEQLLRSARRTGIPIYFTKAYAMSNHRPQPKEHGRWRCPPAWHAEGENLPPADEVVERLQPLEGEVVIHKAGRPSAFFGTQLASMLTWDLVDTVIVTGMTTSGCVRATVLDAFQYNYRVLVPQECVADRSHISHAVSLFDMHMKYADVVTLSEAMDYLDSCGR